MIKATSANAKHLVAFISAVAVAVAAAATAAAAVASFIKGIFDTITTISNHNNDEANHNNDEAACAVFADALLQQHATLATAEILGIPDINQSFAKLIYAAGENIEQKAFIKYAAIAAIARANTALGTLTTGATVEERIQYLQSNVTSSSTINPVLIVQAAGIIQNYPFKTGNVAIYFNSFTIPAPNAAVATAPIPGPVDSDEDVKRVVNSICCFINGRDGAIPYTNTPPGLLALYKDLFGNATIISANGTSPAVQPNAGKVRGDFLSWAQIKAFLTASVTQNPTVADNIINYIVKADTAIGFQLGGNKKSYQIKKLKKSKTNNKKSKKYHSRNNKYNKHHNLHKNLQHNVNQNIKKYSVKHQKTKHQKTKNNK
jgi:hypothetical protein